MLNLYMAPHSCKMHTPVICHASILTDTTKDWTTSSPALNIKLHYIEFTFCHDMFLNMATLRKIDKYSPFIAAVKEYGWQMFPLVVIIACQPVKPHHSQWQLSNLSKNQLKGCKPTPNDNHNPQEIKCWKPNLNPHN